MDSPQPQAKDTLLIDAGNTRIKWARLVGGEMSAIKSAVHVGKDLSSLFSDCWGSDKVPDRIVVSNVAGDRFRYGLSEWTADHWDKAAEFLVSPKTAQCITNGYRQPDQLGVDRWLTFVAARHDIKAAVCIVDAGTALTIDVIDQVGCHHGGLILPGLALMRQALLERTHIPDGDAKDNSVLLADNTASAVSSASLQASVALIERVIAMWQKENRQNLRLLLTGSDGDLLAAHLDLPCHVRTDLVMKGLQLTAEGEKELP